MHCPAAISALFDPDAIWPYFLVMGALMGLGWLILKASAFYRATCLGEPGRFESLDGLRGFLALAVLFHHASHHLSYRRTGQWDIPSSRFYEVAGPLPVVLFFMITGFLFWSKAIARRGKIPPLELYASRAWRIAPMYLVSMGLILIGVFLQTGLKLNVSAKDLAGNLFPVANLGLTTLGKINGVDTVLLNNGVTWTLKYEWYFYLALPALALLVKPRWFLMVLVIWTAMRLWPTAGMRKSVEYLTLFVGGMGAAYLAPMSQVRRVMGHHAWSLVILAMLAATVLWAPYPIREGSRTLGVAVAMFVVILSFAAGNSLFGVMTLPATKVLGTISYSMYLIHGLVLGGIFYLAARFHPEDLSGLEYWAIVLISGLLTVGLSAVSYRWVEHPGIEMGRRKKTPGHTEAQRPAAVGNRE